MKNSSNGRQISTNFINLPSKRELPEYYHVISQPIDFNRIRKNLKNRKYDTINSLERDIHLLCQNAQTFNREDSEIYRDSKILLGVWKTLKASAVNEDVSELEPQPGPSGISKYNNA
uniref:Bromo domain-containing protein n=1 Tax=Panagrolaimus davidi TaxID=227884 RepID=A0A914R112_9BILA